MYKKVYIVQDDSGEDFDAMLVNIDDINCDTNVSEDIELPTKMERKQLPASLCEQEMSGKYFKELKKMSSEE